MESPSMPRKFQPVRIENEPEKEFLIRKQGAINNFKNEVDLLLARCTRHEETYKNVDVEMVKHLQDTYDKEEAKEIVKKWNTECREQEKVSMEIFKKKEEFLKENLTDAPRERRNNISEREDREKPKKVRDNSYSQKQKNKPDDQRLNFRRGQKPPKRK